MGSGPLERAHADVAGGDAGEHGARQRALAVHRFAGGHDCQTARCGNAERVHRFTDDVLSEHGAEGGAAISATRIRRPSRAFELHVESAAIWRDLLAEQDGASVAQRREVTELVTGVRLRQRARARRHLVAGEERGTAVVSERIGVQPQGLGQRRVQYDDIRCSYGSGRHVRMKELWERRIGVLQMPASYLRRTMDGIRRSEWTAHGRAGAVIRLGVRADCRRRLVAIMSMMARAHPCFTGASCS